MSSSASAAELPPGLEAFIDRWSDATGKERANCHLFMSELCTVLDLEQPEPAHKDESLNAYAFERKVTMREGGPDQSYGFIDLYKRGCFVLEAKQTGQELGSGRWDTAMYRAKGQAMRYARALPADEGRPPFIVVTDVGRSIELYSEFSRTGGEYVPFPDPKSHRLKVADLRKEEVRERLRAVWNDPLSLDPTRLAARVTREIAQELAGLARSLEARGNSSERVASFLMRCVFTMFAEDVGLLPASCFTDLLESLNGDKQQFVPMVEDLWRTMNKGGFSVAIRGDVLRFNGGLFADNRAIEVEPDDIELLLNASRFDWKFVEPTIFGTLLERALDPRERHNLGAHYTPREYVERLVIPTVIQPMRDEWEVTMASALALDNQGKRKQALKSIKSFHERLCHIRVLDPACGSGNFLYVALELLKRLEGEVLNALIELGEVQGLLGMQGISVGPHQFLGIETNPRAARIAETVIWIGYLQWHFRSVGNVQPPEPVLAGDNTIENRDALMQWERTEVVRGEDGSPETRWDGETTKVSPVTGRNVPDESAQVLVERLINPTPAEWPGADFIVGNPPFIGAAPMRQSLGHEYVEALRATIPDVPESSDYVMYWWHHAAELVRTGKASRFGFITTNSLKQTFNRRVLEQHVAAKPPLSIALAIPDHPWVDGGDGAAVRIAMTVGVPGEVEGTRLDVTNETQSESEGVDVEFLNSTGRIHADLSIGVNVAAAAPLIANTKLSNRGVSLHGPGFIVTPERAKELGLGRIAGLERHIRHYRNGRDINQASRNVMVIDLFGLEAAEVQDRFPEVYQHVLLHVKPERDKNNRRSRRENWWLFGEPNPLLRSQLSGLQKFITTVETSKHRVFVFLDKSILPDNKLVNIALDAPAALAVLSSHIHVAWSLATGSHLGVGNDPVYVKTKCFDAFPFPTLNPNTAPVLSRLGKRLDQHRNRQQERHPSLRLTDVYNVLEKLRAEEDLTAKDKEVNEKGLVSTLLQIHEEIDQATADAYGWPHDLGDEEVLERLVALNAVRSAEEKNGVVQWLRPEYQNPAGERAIQGSLSEDFDEVVAEAAASTQAKWPRSLSDQVQAIKSLLDSLPTPLAPDAIARNFKRPRKDRVNARKDRIEEILSTLERLGQAVHDEEGRYFAA